MSTIAPSPKDKSELLTDPEQLVEPFHEAEKPRDVWRIGSEAEKFGVVAPNGEPLAYEGDHGVVRVLDALMGSHGWRADAEYPGGPLIALKRENASLTLEPGAQLELSGAPLPDIHLICAEMRGHVAELRQITSEMNLSWLAVGFHPTARQEDLTWVPKQRYAIMREYLPTKGTGALDMMRRTATVQANIDYSDEEDAMRKLRVGLVLAPLVNAMTANSPFYEGRLAGKKSVRGEIWLRMDPSRSGLVPQLWDKERPRYADYAEWALDAGMFLFKRDGQVIANTGQTFRSFMKDGFSGHHATLADWKLHLQTVFPEARLKNTLEFRPCDALPTDMTCCVSALYTGLMYDAKALDQVDELAKTFSYESVASARPALVTSGLAAEIGGRSARELAEQVLDIALGGLERRGRLNAQGQDERVHLRRLVELNQEGLSPADRLTEGLHDDDPDLRREILARTKF